MEYKKFAKIIPKIILWGAYVLNFHTVNRPAATHPILQDQQRN